MSEKKEKETKKQEEKQEKKTLEELEINSPEELQELLDKLSGSGNNGDKKVKKIGIVNRLFPNVFVNLLFYVALYLIITLAIQGYFGIFLYKNFYELLIYVLIFSVLDTLGKDLLYSKVPFIVLTSFGIVLLIWSVACSLVPIILLPNIDVLSNMWYALYLVIILVVRLVVTQYVSRIRLKAIHKKFSKKPKE